MMAAHLFNSNGQMQEVDIPDIFDVLEGGEDESAVKFLLGFSADEDDDDGIPAEHVVLESSPQPNPSHHNIETISFMPTVNGLASTGESNSSNESNAASTDAHLTKEGKPRKRDPVDPSRCIYNCDNCDKAFTTKFNLKRHINLHCNKSKEAGVPVQGPPSASMPSRKARERRMALAAMNMEGGNAPAPKKKLAKSSKSKPKNPKRNSKSNKQVVQMTTTTHPATVSTPTVVQASSKPHLQQQQQQQSQLQHKPSIVIQKGNLPASSTITYQVGGQQHTVKAEAVSFQINNNIPQQIVRVNHQQQQQQSMVRLAAPNHQQPKIIHLQQQQHQQVRQPMLPVQPLPASSLQMIQVVQQQPSQQQQFFQQRIVRLVQNHQQAGVGQNFPRQATIVGHIQGANGTIPILQQSGAHGILQAIPVSLLPSSAAKTLSNRPITLPQQPLPVVQAIQTSSASTHLKPILSNGSFPVSTFAGVSSVMPKLANATPFLQQQQQQQQNETQTSNNVSHLPSSFLSTTTTSLNRIENELSCPPEDLFDSEDASSVATTTEAPSPISSIPYHNDDDDDNEVKDFNFLSDHIDENISFVDDDVPMDNIVETSTVNVIVTSSSNNLMDFAEFLENGDDDDEMESNEAVANSLDLPSNPDRGQLQEIPRGWIRKIIPTSSGLQKVFYYNPTGKRFGGQDEIDQHFVRLGQTVMPGLFNFEPPKLVDEDDDDYEDDEDDEDEMCGLQSIEKSPCSSTTTNATLQQQMPTLLT